MDTSPQPKASSRCLPWTVRPFHVWWVAVVVFGMSVLIWALNVIPVVAVGWWNCPLDWPGIRQVYLPMFAAVVGFAVPVVALGKLKHSRCRVWLPIFLTYVLVMLTWAIIDIRCQNYQLGGHDYPNNPVVDGHKYYYHQYYTWYFMPYRLIEEGIRKD
jgi:hypothetical protein